jgi:hypothetical protein
MASRGRRDFSIDDAFEESEEDRVSYCLNEPLFWFVFFFIEVMRIPGSGVFFTPGSGIVFFSGSRIPIPYF